MTTTTLTQRPSPPVNGMSLSPDVTCHVMATHPPKPNRAFHLVHFHAPRRRASAMEPSFLSWPAGSQGQRTSPPQSPNSPVKAQHTPHHTHISLSLLTGPIDRQPSIQPSPLSMSDTDRPTDRTRILTQRHATNQKQIQKPVKPCSSHAGPPPRDSPKK